MLRKVVVLVGLVALLSAVGWVGYAQGGGTVPGTQTWEYLVDLSPWEPIQDNLETSYYRQLLNKNRDAMQRLLDRRGAEGWEVVAIGAAAIYFKRPK